MFKPAILVSCLALSPVMLPLALAELSDSAAPGGEPHPEAGTPSSPLMPALDNRAPRRLPGTGQPRSDVLTEAGTTSNESPSNPTFEYEELFLDVEIAGYYQRPFVYTVLLPDNTILVSRQDLEPLPFRADGDLVYATFLDTEMLDVTATAGLSATLDAAAATLVLRPDASLLSPYEEDFDPKLNAEDLPPRAPGAHFNYSLGWSGSEDDMKLPGAFFQGFWYRGHWTLRSSFSAAEDDGFRRLTSTFLLDNPKTLRQWALGDVTAPAGSEWGSSRSLMGVSWGTDFDMDPGFTPFQDYSIFGETEQPAVAEIISEGELIRQIELPPGPFAFQNINVPDAYGNLVVRVTDRVGNQSFYEVPYIRIGRLYKQGLYDYNFTAGLRPQSTNDFWGSRYFGFGASTTHRYGFSETLTGELHAEASERSAALGVSATRALPRLNLLYTTALSGSQSPQGTGARASLALEQVEVHDSPFVRVGMTYRSRDYSLSPEASGNRERPRLDLRLNPSWGALGFPLTLSYQYSDGWGGRHSHQFGLNYSVNLGPLRIGLTGGHRIGRDDEGEDVSDTSAFLTLSLPFGKGRRLASSTFNLQGETVSAGAQLVQYAPTDRGLGFQLAANARDINESWVDNFDGFMEWNSGIGRGTARISHRTTDSSRTYNANFSGAVGLFDGEVFFARSLSGPYALVRTGDATNLPLYLNRNPVRRSNTRGWTVLDGMLGFERNLVEFKPEDLEFDIDMEGVDPQREVITWDYGGTLVEFPLTTQLPVNLRLWNAAGEPLPSGSQVINTVNGEKAYVALDGQVFLRRFTENLRLDIDAGKFGTCRIETQRPEDFRAFDSIEPLSCTLQY